MRARSPIPSIELPRNSCARTSPTAVSMPTPASTTNGHVVAIRALPDYDALFGVDFDSRPDLGAARTEGK